MPLRNPSELCHPPFDKGRLLGLDVGEKTIGLALCDAGRSIASPLETLARGKLSTDARHLGERIAQHEVTALVIGLPINMDGSEGPRCQSVRQFAQNILKTIEINIVFWDERLSTAAVTRTLLEADLSRRKRSAVVDKMAAAYILQGYLDFLREQQKKNP